MKKILFFVETFMILFLLVIILAVIEDKEQYTQNCNYMYDDYEYLNVLDFDEVDEFIKKTPNYFSTSEFLWNQANLLLSNIYLHNENETLITYSKDISESNIFEKKYIDTVVADTYISGNVSVVNVIHYSDRAIISYVYSMNIKDEYGNVLYHDEIDPAYPIKLLLRKKENDIWFVEDIMIAV